MKINKLYEKFNINPMKISDLTNLKSYTYIIWFFHLSDIDEFCDNVSKKFKKNDIKNVKVGGIKLILISEVNFDNYYNLMKDKSLNLFYCNLNIKDTVEYLNNNKDVKKLYDIKNELIDDPHIKCVDKFFININEKLHINPIKISDLNVTTEYTQININTIRYHEVTPGYIVFIRSDKNPYVCMDKQNVNNIGLSTYDCTKYLVNYDYDHLYCTYIEMTDYLITFPRDEMNDHYDIVKIYEPSTLKKNFKNRVEFIEYYEEIMKHFGL